MDIKQSNGHPVLVLMRIDLNFQLEFYIMFTINIVDGFNKIADKVFETILELLEFIELVKTTTDEVTYQFGKMNESGVLSTQYIVINVNGIKKLDNLAPYHYFQVVDKNGDKFVIAPIEQSLNGQQLLNANLALADELGIASLCDGTELNGVNVQSEPFTLDAQDLKGATVNTGIISFPLPFTFLPASLAQKMAQIVVTGLISILELYNGFIEYVGKDFFFYNPDTGIWDRKSEAQVKRFLFNEFCGGIKDIKDLKKSLNELKISTAKDRIQQNKDCHVLALQNCSYDPISGRMLGFHHGYYALSSLPFSYNPSASCPLWEKFLLDVFGEDDDCAEKIALLQEGIGLSLTKVIKAEKMLFLIGGGANGKSVILNIVKLLLGHRNVSHVALKDLQDKFKFVMLDNKLVNIDSDIDKACITSDAAFKQILSGETKTTEHKYGAVVDVTPHVKIWAAGNHMPSISNSCHAIYRRMAIIEFNRTFAKHEQDPFLINTLRAELSGIFNWALKGLERCISNDYKLTNPASSTALMEEFELNNNPVKRFVNDCIEILPKTEKMNTRDGVKSIDFLNRYNEYASLNGYAKLRDTEFSTILKSLGIERKKSGNFRYYNIKIKDLSDELNGDVDAANDNIMQEKASA